MSLDLKQIIEKEYPLGKVQDMIRLKSGVSNENYKVTTDTGNYIARVCHFEPQNQINVMLPFLEYAASVNYPAPRLIKTTHNAGYYGSEAEPVIVTTVIDGQAGSHDTINEKKLSSLGTALAQLHKLTWSPEKPSKTANTTYILDVYRQFSGSDFERTHEVDEFLQVLAEDSSYFASEAAQSTLRPLPLGLIHNDVIPSNVLFEKDTVASFVDLEEVSQGIMLLDVARVINTWCFADDGLSFARLVAFLSAYNHERPLMKAELSLLPLVMHFVDFRNCVYGMKMIAQKRIQTIAEVKEYENLKFVKYNQAALSQLVASSLNQNNV